MASASKPSRLLTDAAGYGLLLLALLTGWLPGPGGIPLALAGLGLLSIHNAWARRLRDYGLTHGKELVHRLFLDNPALQLTYDIVVIALLTIAFVLGWLRDNRWEVAFAGVALGLAIGIWLANRGRYQRIVRQMKHKR